MGKGACWSSVNLISQSTNYFIHLLDINLKTYAFCNFFFPFFTNFPLALLASLLHEFNYVNQNAELCYSRCHVFYSAHWVDLVRLRRERKRVGGTAERKHGPLGICSSTNNSKQLLSNLRRSSVTFEAFIQHTGAVYSKQISQNVW